MFVDELLSAPPSPVHESDQPVFKVMEKLVLDPLAFAYQYCKHVQPLQLFSIYSYMD